MKLKIDDEFKKICSEIISENKTDEEWSEIESGDMFQSEHYCGGYEDGVFAFGYFGRSDQPDKEFWFEVPLSDLKKIVANEIEEVELNERKL